MNRPGPLRAAGFAAVLLFLVLVGRFWHPVYRFTSFLQLDASNDGVKIAAFHRLPVYVYRDTGGYDGLYYAEIAYHPLLRSPELRPAMDNLSYRARRILVPALAWLLAAGRPKLIVQVYSVLNVLAWLALAPLAWRLLRVRDGRSWLAWAGLLFSAGALLSVRFALTDLVTLLALAAAMAAAESPRPGWAAAGLAAAGLGRETAVAALPGLLGPPWLSWRNFGRAAAALLPLAAWLLYVRWQTAWDDQPWGNFTWPGAGWLERWQACFSALRHLPEPLLAWTTLLTMAGLTAQAAYFLQPRWSDPWWRFGAPYVVLLLCFGTAVWEGFPGASPRVLLPLSLAFFVLVVRQRSSWLWLTAGLLTVPSGLLTLAHATSDPREIAAARGSHAAAVVRAGPGWFGGEHAGRHVWSWSSSGGELEVQAWPRSTGAILLDFSLRGLGQRRVAIRQGGRELWQGEVGRELRPHEIAVSLENGRADLQFSTDAPGMREGAGPEARSLAFAIYDPRIRFPLAMLLLDLSHTSHSRAQTGIQRVARRLWRELGGEASPVCYDPYFRAWRGLEPWELETLASSSAAWRRSVQWPAGAKIRGRLKRWSGMSPRRLPPASFFTPEIFSVQAAEALPRLFAQVSGARTAVFHDAIALKFPELTPAGTVGRFPSYLQELLAFDGIAADSEESRQTLVDYWRWLGVAAAPEVTVIPLGTDPAPEPGPTTPGRPATAPVVLCVSTVEGRKNHLALVEACESLWGKERSFGLHLVGIPRPETAKAALDRIAQLQRAGRPLRYEGAVDDRAVEAAYAAADFTIYPSLMEGSGLPVRESLARGKPCICSGTGALGEVAREGGCLLLPALDAAAIAAAIDRLLQSPAERSALASAARARPVRNWADVARDLSAWVKTVKRRS